MGIPPVHQEPPGVRCRRKGWLGTAVSLPLVLAFLLTVFHKVDAFLGPLSWTSYRGRTGRSQQPLLQAATRWSETEGPPVIRTLLIDNYDSYTYNLVNYLATVNGVAPLVVYNDAYDGDWEALVKAVGPFDNIVLSPGPGTPKNPADFGLCLNALQQSTIPVLGESTLLDLHLWHESSPTLCLGTDIHVSHMTDIPPPPFLQHTRHLFGPPGSGPPLWC